MDKWLAEETEEMAPILIVEPKEIVAAVVEEVDEEGGLAHVLEWEVSIPFRFCERHRLEVTPKGVFFSPHHVILRPPLATGDRLGCDFSGAADFRWCCWADWVAARTQKKIWDRMRVA
jgi:hypothetical protein